MATKLDYQEGLKDEYRGRVMQGSNRSERVRIYRER